MSRCKVISSQKKNKNNNNIFMLKNKIKNVENVRKKISSLSYVYYVLYKVNGSYYEKMILYIFFYGGC